LIYHLRKINKSLIYFHLHKIGGAFDGGSANKGCCGLNARLPVGMAGLMELGFQASIKKNFL